MKVTRKKLLLLLHLIIAISLLSGCLYPEDKLKQNQVPYLDQLASVQLAVEQFQQDNSGLLPIKTRDMTTPIYQKYPIDFNKLIPRYMQDTPGTSFESGGVYLYVLVDVETNPTVKLFDLTLTETIREINFRLDDYRRKNGYPPFKEVVSNKVFTLDFKKLGYTEEPYVVSPFTGNNLSFVINDEVDIFVDYRPDLYAALQKSKNSYVTGDDIRDILVQDSMFVPAHSLPYTIDPDKKEPIFLDK
ncbi:hypothetical protein PY093_05735 [Cytobacillus sp. S13-E01]|uniref:hypothetical protein n=1 Tax=Cytobacillus sp. S13-E01 TaxID=3031326 RepID=UPI0023D809DB|nr:hypothetical protein [Cytobacillus sp. S13-E01]MDF0726214.1 hypothetical protein [Cytobacillus sp. S13-E01]